MQRGDGRENTRVDLIGVRKRKANESTNGGHVGGADARAGRQGECRSRKSLGVGKPAFDSGKQRSIRLHLVASWREVAACQYVLRREQAVEPIAIETSGLFVDLDHEI